MHDLKEQQTAVTAEAATQKPEKPKKKKSTMRRVKSISPMAMMIPFIMVDRVGSQNFITDRIRVEKIEKYLKEKQAEGMKNISMMHVLIAAYVRMASQRPAVNRFIRGQRVWTRDEVEISLTIKKEMSLESPDTCVKITVERDATMADVYEALNREITAYRDAPGGDFDKTAKALSMVPALLLKFVVWFLRVLDYFGGIPKFLTGVSPFHCSFFITSMGSLGIPPIYHHLYDFGTCPAFCSFGAKKREYGLEPDGTVTKQSYMDVTFVLDERICDGYYFASCLRMFKNILRDPWQLDTPPAEVKEDAP